MASKKSIHQTFIIMAASILTLPYLHGCGLYSPPKPHPELIGYSETGKASYYSLEYQFRRTASGERLNNFAMTAAHRTLPFGSIVLVTNIKNGKSVTVKINDRGPYVKGRIIDLTRAAFSEIGDLDSGTLQVRIEVTG